jgi:hypothetical protein
MEGKLIACDKEGWRNGQDKCAHSVSIPFGRLIHFLLATCGTEDLRKALKPAYGSICGGLYYFIREDVPSNKNDRKLQ